MTAVIYKATNLLNGKSYVGYTKNFQNRVTNHINFANSTSKLPFHRAIRKYGPDNFNWVILKENATKQDEILFIQSEKTYLSQHGYNATLGGEGSYGYKHTSKTKKHMSKIHSNRSVEWRQKISKANSGRKLTEEHKQKTSETMRGRPKSPEHIENARKALIGSKKPNAKQYGGSNNNAKAIVTPFGEFGCIRDASRSSQYSVTQIRHRLKSPKYSDWSYI